MFHLPPLLGLDYDGSGPRIPPLPGFHDQLSLPSLDGSRIPISDRMLAALSDIPQYNDRRETEFADLKGKGRETPSPTGRGPEGLDIWRLLNELQAARPSKPTIFQPLRTWDVLADSPPYPVSSSTLMSEHPPNTVDCLNTVLEPDLGRATLSQAGPSTVRDSQTLLGMLLRSTMGSVTTSDIVWDKRTGAYRWRTASPRASGLDQASTTAMTERFLALGTAMRRLEMIIDQNSATPLTPTHHALLHAVSSYTTHIRTRLSAIVDSRDEASPSDWHAASSSFREINELCKLLCETICWPMDSSKPLGMPARASSLLSHLHALLTAQLSGSAGSSTSGVLCSAYLLESASRPFLSLLDKWLGLGPVPMSTAEDGEDPYTQPWEDLGITRTIISGPRVHFEFSSKMMPTFVPKPLRRGIFEAGKSLRLLKEASQGRHPLCTTTWEIKTSWGWVGAQASPSSDTVRRHVRRVQRAVDAWSDSMRNLSGSAIRLSRAGSIAQLANSRVSKKERKRLPPSFYEPRQDIASQSPVSPVPLEVSPKNEIYQVDAFWSLFSKAPGSHLEHLEPDPAHKDVSTLWTARASDSMDDFLSRYGDQAESLLPRHTPTLDLFISERILSPLTAHGRLISSALVSLYLDDLHLTDHYDVLHSYFLAGNPGFMERVSAALFGNDDTANSGAGLGRRDRTRARLGLPRPGAESIPREGQGQWGAGLGIGMSERSKWPPGGSELAFTLRSTLLDGDKANDEDNERGEVWSEVENRVSFAIRELPEELVDGKRAKWMNPQAIEALDFLYLTYSIPRPIDELFPADLLAKYQTINNFLLRICRVKRVLQFLYLDIIHTKPHSSEHEKAVIDSTARSRSTRNRRDQDLTAPTAAGDSLGARDRAGYRLHHLRFQMSGFIIALERYMVDTAIGTNWRLMRDRLEKLKKRSKSRQSSRPASPMTLWTDDFEHSGDAHPDMEKSGVYDDDSEDENDKLNMAEIGQLQSIHSLVAYHDLTMDKILRSMLLHPSASYQTTFAHLMKLFELVLDLGKLVKEIQGGSIDPAAGLDRLDKISIEWGECQRVFSHALERLSLRSAGTGTSATRRTPSDDGRAEGRREDVLDHDMHLLLSGENREGDVDGTEGPADPVNARVGGQGDDGNLGELLLRLNLGSHRY